jgi:outer membrane immunogenic protein
MRKITVLAAASAALFAAGAAAAQDGAAPATSTSFKGFRVEAQAGLDRFQSQGTHKDKFGWGVEAGWDGQIGEKIVVGPYGSYWRGGRGENVTTGTGGAGVVTHKSFEEWGAGVRAG